MAPVFAQTDFLTVEDLGAIFKLCPRSVLNLRRVGLPLFPLTPGGRLVALWPDVAAWIMERKQNGGPVNKKYAAV